MNAELKRDAGLDQLWQEISDFSLDEPTSDLTFTERLARENGWSLLYARRVASEYKRFMFLAVAAGHAVTPSEQVDQAWHLHLIYTQSYWDDFCGRVLGRKVHHGPTKGGSAEEAKYHEWYERTKASYARLFGGPPPADIWPNSDERFGDDLHQRRVNTRRNWVIPKPQWPRMAAAWVVIGLVSLLVLCSAFIAQSRGGEKIAGRSGHPARESVDTSADSTAMIVIVGSAVVVAVLLVVAGIVCGGQHCSACHRWYALAKTGVSKPAKPSGVSQDEWRCKYCGDSTWKNTPVGGAYSGGCAIGGWGGCGAGGCGAGGCGAGGCGGGGCGGGGCGS